MKGSGFLYCKGTVVETKQYGTGTKIDIQINGTELKKKKTEEIKRKDIQSYGQ